MKMTELFSGVCDEKMKVLYSTRWLLMIMNLRLALSCFLVKNMIYLFKYFAFIMPLH